MADKLRLHTVFAVKGLFKREDDQHLADKLLHQFDAVLLPGPQLRADKKDDGNTEAMKFPGEPEVNLREVNEDGDLRTARADGFLEFAEFAVDTGQMADHFRKAHDSHILRAHDAIHTGRGHAVPAHPEQLRCFTLGRELARERSG